LIDDDSMRRTMGVLFRDLKLCVEPAGAAALAAALGPLRSDLQGGQRVGIVVCGSNIDLATFSAQAGMFGV
jgi:threonine dehydratase